MSDKDTTQQHMQTVTVGQFEFTSIPLSSIEAKKGADYAQDHVLLRSIELLGDNSTMSVVIQEEENRDESLQSPELRREVDNDKARDSFISKLAEQLPAQSSQPGAAKLPKVPTSLSELGQYRENAPKVKLPLSINPTDNTMLQLVDTIAKLPDDYKLTLLNYLRSVEDIYENRSA